MVILSSLPPPTEGIRHTESNAAAFINQQNFGPGTLYIAESRLSWVSNAGQGFSLEYPAIALHAISKDTNAFPHHCLYLMIDSVLTDPSQDAAANVAKASAATDCIEMAEKMKGVSVSNQNTDTDSVVFLKNTSAQSRKTNEKGDGEDFLSPSCGVSSGNGASSTCAADHNGHERIENGEATEDDEETEHEEAQITEIRFVPTNPSSLEAIFQAMAECQAMHPDENESFSDDESGSMPMEGGVGGFLTAEDFDDGELDEDEAMEQDTEMMDNDDPALYEDAPDDNS